MNVESHPVQPLEQTSTALPVYTMYYPITDGKNIA